MFLQELSTRISFLAQGWTHCVPGNTWTGERSRSQGPSWKHQWYLCSLGWYETHFRVTPEESWRSPTRFSPGNWVYASSRLFSSFSCLGSPVLWPGARGKMFSCLSCFRRTRALHVSKKYAGPAKTKPIFVKRGLLLWAITAQAPPSSLQMTFLLLLWSGHVFVMLKCTSPCLPFLLRLCVLFIFSYPRFMKRHQIQINEICKWQEWTFSMVTTSLGNFNNLFSLLLKYNQRSLHPISIPLSYKQILKT